jgi:alkaline phosphatase D
MNFTRRTLIKMLTIALVSPRLVVANSGKPVLNIGCAAGDVTADGAMLWTRADRPSRLWVDIDTTPQFSHPVRYQGSAGVTENDFNMHCDVKGLPSGQAFFYRLIAESLAQAGVFSEPMLGQFSTAPNDNRSVRFCWSGDTVGQGYGIDKARGGMKIYQTMAEHKPDFFVHSGDQIYADNPLVEHIKLDDGTTWNNIVTKGKSHVAETIQDYRDNYYYNYLDDHYRQFYSTVPLYQQWDDHDVRNDWYPGEMLNDDRYQEKRISVLAQRAKQAMFECNPMRPQADGSKQVYRQYRYGPMLELFFIDLRSYRGPKSTNKQTEQSAETAFMGNEQLQWLKKALAESTATWKIICSDMPIGLIVKSWGTDFAENGANGDGPALGRELETAQLLNHIHREKIKNVHFITADVHYCSSNLYQPEKAQYTDFSPFWEFVSGPLHAGTFGPNPLDNTFGPEQVFIGIPEGMKANRPPSEGFQFFGQIDIDSDSKAMTVSHFDVADNLLWSITLNAEQ